MASPDVRVAGVSVGSNNDSLHKIKTALVDQNKKIPIKKPVKNDKNYNDYF